MSMDTSMEEDSDSFDSNTDAIIYGISDHSGVSMISGPNITSSSSSEDDDERQQQISTAAGGSDDNSIASSCGSSRIPNDDFRPFSGNNSMNTEEEEKGLECKTLESCSGSELGLRLNIGGAVNEETSNTRLINISVACFEALKQNNLDRANALLGDLRMFAIQQFGDMKKVATDYAEVLDRMIHGIMNPQCIHQTPKPTSLKLKFLSKVYCPVYTGVQIKGEGGTAIDVALVDDISGEIVDSVPEAFEKVEIVFLSGDFGDDGGENWTSEEFSSNIVRRWAKNTVHLRLNSGIGCIERIGFAHTRQLMKKSVFRLGARVIECSDGTRVKEAKTEPFTVMDQRLRRVIRR